MSPAQILERCYQALKQRLVEGEFHPGQRLEAVRLADEMHVSMTPVRDVLNRLTGEGLVDAIAGGGFYVPVPDEGGLRDLLDWNALLALYAAGSRQRTVREGTGSPDDIDRTASLFFRLAESLGNREMMRTVGHLNDRLYAMRLLDARILGETGSEILGLEEALMADNADLSKRIRAYHRRRKARVATYVRLLRKRP
ncbi:DNA-binding transcriptional MocR family regulator [Sphingobium xenophagum]|uniref:DNA-binding transcriptional MocR family regulator n=1 Tax=Sphingobium xenophagum TaxID=121428 RepID=A0ABU1WZW2_SPHXE|nr:GntR family transcriptional regulator [Sphingobium xenophagum]MDR7154851.1 DNA-binding transcriptional MocR family regulator [Sphingobium xenophagum]